MRRLNGEVTRRCDSGREHRCLSETVREVLSIDL